MRPDHVALAVLLIAAGLAHAVLQEHLQQIRLPLLMTAAEFGVSATLSASWRLCVGAKPGEVPRLQLLRISVCILASLLSGNIALAWVSYPVKVVAKSCKLLPTMVLGSVLLRKRYSALDHVAASLLCAGLVGFTLSEHASVEAGDGNGSSPLGIGLLLFAVSCDAVQILLSERMLRSHPHMTPMHVMLYTNSIAFAGVACALLGTGELRRAPDGVPWAVLCLMGSTSWLGVCCFIELTRALGGTAAVVMTNVRKLISIVLSFVIFPKPWGTGFVLSCGAVVAGCAIRMYERGRGGAAKGARAH